jgi:hypothetical protein
VSDSIEDIPRPLEEHREYLRLLAHVWGEIASPVVPHARKALVFKCFFTNRPSPAQKT